MVALSEMQRPQATLGKQWLVLLRHAFVLWVLCGATMMIGLAVASEATALIVHAVGAPIFAGVVSWNYFTRYGYTMPLESAFAFLGFVMIVDFFLVALVFNRSLEMFANPLGTWIPFALIFLSTYLTGREVERRKGGFEHGSARRR